MNIAISVYEYGRLGNCVCMLRYSYATIRIIFIQIETWDRNVG